MSKAPELTGRNQQSALGERVIARNDDRSVMTPVSGLPGMMLVHRFRRAYPTGELSELCGVCFYPREAHESAR